MDTEEIRRSAIIMGFGYLFLTLFTYIVLANEPLKLTQATHLQNAFYVGFTLLTAGAFIATREHKYFKACFISFLCLDVVIIGYIAFGTTCKYVPVEASNYKLAMNIITAVMNAVLALGNGLFVSGMKEVYGKKKRKGLFAYAMTIEYGVTGLLLFSTIQSFIDFSNGNALAGIILDLTLNTLIYLNYAIFMFVVFGTLKKPKLNKEDKK